MATENVMTAHDFTSGTVVQERGDSGPNKTAKRHGKNAMALPLSRDLRSFVPFQWRQWWERIGTLSLEVEQAFEPAGSWGCPVQCSFGRLESRPNRQTGMSALHVRGWTGKQRKTVIVMKALVKKERKPGLWLEEVPEPQVGINDVLIRVDRTGICGTDLHIYKWDDWAQTHHPRADGRRPRVRRRGGRSRGRT